MWDEQFPGIGDSDYLLRSLIWNKKNISLNDVGQGRIVNQTTEDVDYGFYNIPFRTESILMWGAPMNATRRATLESTFWRSDVAGDKINMYADTFIYKWGPHMPQISWSEQFKEDDCLRILRPIHPQVMMYPYFERAINSPEEKFAFYPQSR